MTTHAPGSRPMSRYAVRIVSLTYLAVLVVAPIGFVFHKAFAGGFSAFWDAVRDPMAVHPLVLTIEIALIAVPLDVCFGVIVALLVARGRLRGLWLLNASVDIPLAISPVIVGLALSLAYGKSGWFGNWLAGHGITVIFSFPGMVMACAAVALPYVVRSTLPVLQSVGIDQEQVAATLGARGWTIFRRVTLPTIGWGIAYGTTLTLARVLGEFGALSIVSANTEGVSQTMTLYIDDQFQQYNFVGVFSGAVVLASITVVVLLIMTLVRRKESSHNVDLN